MSTIDIKEINEWLQPGDIPAVAKATGIDKSNAYRYMRGDTKKIPHIFLQHIMKKAIKNKAQLISEWNTLTATGTNKLSRA
jgi:Holliday junction resolvasome RuvABC DNA-binding subunit